MAVTTVKPPGLENVLEELIARYKKKRKNFQSSMPVVEN